MKYTREFILRRAFEVFMDRGYDSTSISVLQQELGMSRGAMYRHFKNKEELFISVVNEYFFKPVDRSIRHIQKKENVLVSEFIEDSYIRLQIMVRSVAKIGLTHTAFLNYTALMIQAAKHYPGFLEKGKQIDRIIRGCWTRALKNSMEADEIRKDIDIQIMAGLFSNISAKETSDANFEDSIIDKDGCILAEGIMKSLKRRKQIMDYLFSLIKK